MSIWKFTLSPTRMTVTMPRGARVVHAHQQGEDVCVWAEVDPDAPRVERKVFVVPTGGIVAGTAVYVGTAHLATPAGRMVLHVYDGGES